MRKSKQGLITRRDFIRGTALTTLGLAMGLTPVAFSQKKPPTVAKKTKVVLIRDENVVTEYYELDKEVLARMVGEGMCELFGTAKFVEPWEMLFTPEDVVGIKANMMMLPTSRELLEILVDNLLAVGVKDDNIYIWDRDQIGQGKEGVQKRLKRMGYDSDHLNQVVKKCTALINVPGLKTHWLSGVALSIKNWCGAIDNASSYHTEDCCSKLGLLLRKPDISSKTRLIIIDALRGLFHGGPEVDPQYVWNYQGLLLGIDHVAVDTVALKIIQAKRDSHLGKRWHLFPPPTHIALADTKYHKGTSDLNKIDIVKLGWQKDILI